MDSKFELIRYNETLPARIEVKQGSVEIPTHWHKEIELVYVIGGEAAVTVNSESQRLAPDSFLLINSAENHSLSAQDTKCLILDISYEFAQQFDESLYRTVFAVVNGSGAEEELHNLLWQLSRTLNEKEMPDLRQFSLITEILHVLFVQCRHENRSAPKENDNIRSRHVKLAIEYIERNFREEIIEKSLAETLGVNPLYLGKLFRESTGMLFKDYALKIRLEHAMDALMNKNMSVEDAAREGGFPSKRTFVLKCQKVYGITPYQMLKQTQGKR